MEMNHILVVEDDKEIREGVKIYLQSQGYEVFLAADGIEGLEVMEKEDIHLAIVDIMMPRMDGIRMTMKLREKYDFPVIMLSAKSEEVDKIMGLNIGADDYVTKPFNILEVKARIKAIMRRSSNTMIHPPQPPENSTDIVTGDLRLDVQGRRLFILGSEINVTSREFDLLKILVLNPNKVYSREELLNLVWGYEYPGDVRTVDVHIRRLREKIERNPSEPKYVFTKWGVGYYYKA